MDDCNSLTFARMFQSWGKLEGLGKDLILSIWPSELVLSGMTTSKYFKEILSCAKATIQFHNKVQFGEEEHMSRILTRFREGTVHIQRPDCRQLQESRIMGSCIAKGILHAHSDDGWMRVAQLDICVDNQSFLAERLIACLQKCKTLTHLNLAQSSLGCEEAMKVGELLKCVTTLSHLDLGGTGIGVRQIEHLADSLPRCPSLTYLNLTGNGIGDGLGSTILASALPPAIQHLNLWNTGIRTKGAEKLCSALSECTSLLSLDLGFNWIDFEGTSIFVALAECPQLASLHLGGNVIKGPSAQRIAQQLTFLPSLTKLDLTSSRMDDEGIKGISQVLPRIQNLKNFQLHNNNISEVGAESLAANLPKCDNLVVLNLGRNRLGCTGACFLSQTLGKSPVRNLNLSLNNLSPLGIEYMIESLDTVTGPYELWMEFNGGSPRANLVDCLTVYRERGIRIHL